MRDEAAPDWSRSLGAWLLRDGMLLALLVVVWHALRSWHAASATIASTAVLSTVTFVSAYAACYVVHEWGHDLGARALGARPPRGSIRGAALPLFDPDSHTRAQFLGLSYGGQIAYVGTAAVILAGFEHDLAHRAAALGAIAFVTQSLAVDLGVLGPVLRGANISSAVGAGTAPRVILRRTGFAWSALAGVLGAFHAFGGGLP